ncbi:MAG TPA: NAD(P)H-dependent oxidoreductase [Burkholderiaceae bacterium]|nr:NAD(P)H-dependent oxidoreductase [Burkholderiaceae bacterium]
MTRVLVFAGSARRVSLNKKLARVAAEAVRGAGGAATLIDLADFALPLYHGDLEVESGIPAPVRELAALVRSHAALMIASPENNTSVSALLKNTLDWISRIKDEPAFAGKVAALLAASTGHFGGVRGLYHLRAILNSLGVDVLAQQFVLPRANTAFDTEGRLVDALQAEQVNRLAARLVDVAARLGESPG